MGRLCNFNRTLNARYAGIVRSDRKHIRFEELSVPSRLVGFDVHKRSSYTPLRVCVYIYICTRIYKYIYIYIGVYMERCLHGYVIQRVITVRHTCYFIKRYIAGR